MTAVDGLDVAGRSTDRAISMLLVRPLAEGPTTPEGVTLLVTHEIAPLPAGIEEVRAYDSRGAVLVVSSRTTVDVLAPSDVFGGPWRQVVAAGAETARALREAGARSVTIPEVPGAAGILALLPAELSGLRLLWPRASDAATEPHAVLASRGAQVTSPVVYGKRPLPRLDPEVLARLAAGGFDAVGVTSIAALDVLLTALPGAPPLVPWGVLGPETARLALARGVPAPVVSPRPRIPDLLALLTERVRESRR